MPWRCALGHRWTATPSPIVKKGIWCPTCGHARRAQRQREETFEAVKAIARKHGGQCLSASYDSGTSQLQWKCAQGHRWTTKPHVIQAGHWCRRCALRDANQGLRDRVFKSAQAIARRRGGRCLSTYENAWAKMRWRCAEGHEWDATRHAIAQGAWCARCAGVARHTLEELRRVAKDRGGECLSESYFDASSPVAWRCAAGHRWWANASNVIHQHTWCPRCHGTPRDELARLRGIARRHGGRCLSSEYQGATTDLLWRCRKGHEWWTKPRQVVLGSWCNECRVRRRGTTLSIEDMRALAVERGGKCVSRRYFNVTTHLRWECARGHRWEAVPASIKSGRWCPRCSHTVRGTIDGLRAWAATLGGRCLSTEYDDARTPLRWQCAAGHRFDALAKAVKSGLWCRRCSVEPTRPQAPRSNRSRSTRAPR